MPVRPKTTDIIIKTKRKLLSVDEPLLLYKTIFKWSLPSRIKNTKSI
jgi:hypothetical protein